MQLKLFTTNNAVSIFGPDNIHKCFSDSVIVTKKVKLLGRPIEEQRYAAFLEMINYFLQNDEEQMTISHLVNKMKEFMNSNDEPYSKKYMKL